MNKNNFLNNKGFAISTLIYGTFIIFIVLLATLLSSLNSGQVVLGDRVNTVSNLEEDEPSFPDVVCDTENLEKPFIEETGLIPVYYDEDSKQWIIISADDERWYNYCEQKWANSVILKEGVTKNEGDSVMVDILKTTNKNTEDELEISAMFVWIPRFDYTIGCTDVDGDNSVDCLGYKIKYASDLKKNKTRPGAIDISFVSKTNVENSYVSTDTAKYNYTSIFERTPSNWYTHPAFKFDSTKLSGFWVGKFETIGSETAPAILPNKKNSYDQSLSKQIDVSKVFNNYVNNMDAHIMKNCEWGAVAYLSQSIYGKYGNSNYHGFNKQIYINNYGKFTGGSSGEPSAPKSSSVVCYYDDITDRGNGKGQCGGGASTTGNIYGIYDMNGGLEEFVMGNYNNKNELSYTGLEDSWFTTNTKYYNKFTNSNIFDVRNIQTLGGALVETKNWYSDISRNFDDSISAWWFSRGGDYDEASSSGIFKLNLSAGSSISSFRMVLTPNT